MKKNESKTDRIVRFVIAVVLFIIAYYLPSGFWSAIFYIVAVILLLTAAFGYCPLYQMLGIGHQAEKSAPAATPAQPAGSEPSSTAAHDDHGQPSGGQM